MRVILSSRGWGDYSPVEWIGDSRKSDTEILAECYALNQRGIDVDFPNMSDAEILTAINKAREKLNGSITPPPVHGPGYCYRHESYCYGDSDDCASTPLPYHSTRDSFDEIENNA